MRIAAVIKVDGESVAGGLEEARAQLDGAGTEIVLDFSSVYRVDVEALRALEKLADAAAEKTVTISLGGVSAEVYKALKLMKVSARFSYLG